MLRQFLITSCLLLALAGCYPVHREGFEPSLADDGFKRPKIVLIPAFDSSDANVDWNVAQEISEAVRDHLCQENCYFIYKEGLTFNRVCRMGHFSLDETLEQIRPIYAHTDLVILLELVQHDLLPHEREILPATVCCRDDFRCNNTLVQKLRIVIVDVRSRPVKICLDQILVNTHTIPKECEFWEYQATPWRTSEYEITPLGKAHRCLIDLAAQRIETAILEFR